MSLRRWLAYSFAHKYAVIALALVRVVILGRLLAPDDYGVFMVAQTVILLAALFSDWGVSTFIVQDQELTKSRVRSAFTLTLVSSLVVTVGIIAFRSQLAATLARPEMAELIAVMALSLLLQPFNFVVTAQLQRSMRFGQVLVLGVAGEIAGAASSIALAALGYGAMSLGWGLVAGAAATTLLAVFLAYDVFPLRPSFSGMRDMRSFGLRSTTTAGLRQFVDMAEGILMGRFLGYAATGAFNRATTIGNYLDRGLFDAAKPVALSALSAHSRDGGGLAEPLRKKLSYYSILAWPLAAFMCGAAPHIVQVMLGDGWQQVVPLLQLLTISFLTVPLAVLNFEFFVAAGRLQTFLYQEAAVQALRLVATIVAVHYSIEAVAIGWVLTRITGAILGWYQLFRPEGFTLRHLWTELRGGAAVALLSAVPGLLAGTCSVTGTLESLLVLTAAGSAFAVIWLASAFAVRHPITQELRLGLESLGRRARRPRPLGQATAE